MFHLTSGKALVRGEGEGESNLLKKGAGAYVFSDNVMFLRCSSDCKPGIIIKKTRTHRQNDI